MIDTWMIPSWNGDFRLVAGAVEGTSDLVIVDPTPHERQVLGAFLAKARKKKWCSEELGGQSQTIALSVPVEEVGPVLVKIAKPADRTLTAVTFEGGKLAVSETGDVETLVTTAKTKGKRRGKAVSVARPTPCCPECVPGSVDRASEVLLSFLSEQEHADWAKHRAIMVTGGSSGHRYLIAHRHSRTAVLNKKICYDVDDRCVLHFHDWTVPPEEEVLATKLILEHRESWLRNEATVLQQDREGQWVDLGFMRYKNPFGDASDGRADAALTATFGAVLEAVLRAGGASA